MTLKDIRQQELLQTSSIFEACKGSPDTYKYIMECITRFFKGDYGEIDEEDTAANNQDLQEGEGIFWRDIRQPTTWKATYT